MSQTQTDSFSDKSYSDKVIDGLFGGLQAGLIMALAMMLTSPLFGENPIEVLANFSTSQQTTPLYGLLGHLAVSGIYGVFYAMLLRLMPGALRRRIPGWLAGLAYAVLLMALALGLVIPGLRSPLAEVPLAVLAAGHLAYGLVLGWRVSIR